MPCDYTNYPPDWKAIRERILHRAGHRCMYCGAANYLPHPVTGSRVVLTICHLGVWNPATKQIGDPADKFDVRTENLAALCQKCHLAFDRHPDVKRRTGARVPASGEPGVPPQPQRTLAPAAGI